MHLAYGFDRYSGQCEAVVTTSSIDIYWFVYVLQNTKNNDDLDLLLKQKMPQRVARSNSDGDVKSPQSPYLSENRKRFVIMFSALCVLASD